MYNIYGVYFCLDYIAYNKQDHTWIENSLKDTLFNNYFIVNVGYLFSSFISLRC